VKKALARRIEGFATEVRIRDHTLTVDEPKSDGGEDRGPTPQELLAASLVACTRITMEMYAQRKGWDIGDVEVEVDFEPGQKGECSSFEVILRFPATLDDEQVEKLRVIAGKCPVHRTLLGEIGIEDRVERA
jgi:putative redox protein